MRVDPLKGVPNKREVIAWGMYDLANQSFTLLIITVLFPVYFKKVVVPADPVNPTANTGDALWAYAGAGSLAIVVLASPFVGALADQFGLKKRILLVTGVLCSVLTITLALLGPGDVALAMTLFVVANICYQLGENTLAGFLPEIATQRNIGRVSAIGWTMGYVGALGLLLVVIALMFAFGLMDTSRWPPFFVVAGVWFALGMVIPMLRLRETKPQTRPKIAPGAVIARLGQTLAQASHYQQLARFLLAFFIYGLGVQAIIYFAIIIANDFGLKDAMLLVYTLQITLTAGLSAILTGVYQDRLGAKNTVMIFLGVWILTTSGLLVLSLVPADARIANQWAFWVVGNGVGLGLGGIGASSRAMVGRFTPRHKTAEFFGLWGMTYKSAGVVGLLAFGQVKQSLGDTASMAVLGSFFVVGLVLLLRVNEKRGIRAAKRAQRDESSP